MSTLYTKYRPGNFKEVVGQNHIKITLRHEIESGKTAHAYLFCGPRAVGKTTLARVFAKAVNCTSRKEGESEPCGQCDMCVRIAAGKNLDIIEIDAASHTGVDSVRENIIAASKISPNYAKYKIFIIDEVHMLSISAFNALLKIMEEPPENVIFILCTTEVHKVPATIISRCQRFDFKRISVSDSVKKLSYIVEKEKINIDKKILEDVARRSEGHMRDAESLLGQVIAISEAGADGRVSVSADDASLVIPKSGLAEAIDLISFLGKKNAAEAIRLINKLVDEGADLPNFAGDLVEIARKMMLAKISPALSGRLGLELGESFELKIDEINKEMDVQRLAKIIEKFLAAKKELKSGFIIQLPLELAIVELCTAGVRPAAPSASPKTPPRPMGTIARETPSAPYLSGAPKTAPETDANVDMSVIADKWNEFLAKIKTYNHSLSFVFGVCRPLDIKGNRLCLVFKYKFHKDRINEVEIKRLAEKALREVYGAALIIEAEIDEKFDQKTAVAVIEKPVKIKKKSEDKEEKNGDNMIEKLLDAFGGRVVG